MSHQDLHRPARESDLDRLLEIHLASFPDPRGVDARRRNFEHNALGDLADLHVAQRAGVVVAHAFLFRLGAWFGGRRVDIAAIASVGVAPEARGQGVATSLLAHLHRMAHAGGVAVTLLYPFRQGFYARMGYAAVTPTKRLEIAPRSIPGAWRAGSGVARAVVSRDRAEIVAAYTRAAARTTGWLERPDQMWERMFLDERRRWTVLEREGRLAGYAAWELDQPEPHAVTTARVHELVADDDDAKRRLFGVLAGLGDQVHAITVEVDADDPLDRALVDADGHRHGTHEVEHTLGVVAGGPMVRVDDPARAFAERGYSPNASGAVVIAVDGERDATTLEVTVEGGRARAQPSSRAPALRLGRAALAAVLYGGLRVSQACALGLVDAADPRAVDEADRMLATPPFFAIDRF